MPATPSSNPSGTPFDSRARAPSTRRRAADAWQPVLVALLGEVGELLWCARVVVERGEAGDIVAAPRTIAPKRLGVDLDSSRSAPRALAARAARSGRMTRLDEGRPSLAAIPLEDAEHGRAVLLVAANIETAERWSEVAAVCRERLVRRRPRASGEASRRATPDGTAPVPATRAAVPTLDAVVLGAAANHGRAVAIACAIVEWLAAAPEIARASLGLLEHGTATILAISGQADIDRRRAEVREIEARMVARPDARRGGESDSSGATNTDGRGDVTTSIAIDAPDGRALVLLVEYAHGRVSGDSRTRKLRDALRDPGLLLLRTARAEQPLARRARAAVATRFRNGSTIAKRSRLAAGALGFVALGFVLAVPVPMRISAHATIEAENLRVVVAPDDGHVIEARARAGDVVTRGELLATLDDRDLVLELERLQAEAERNREALSGALAARERVTLAELRADARRIGAELAQAGHRLERTRLRAPFAGIVLKGDAERALGTPVARGEVLYELGSADRHRLVIEVDEHDVALVESGQRVHLRMTAAPERTWTAHIDTLLPVAVASPGGSVFRLPATIEGAEDAPGASSGLRAGMRGVAWIDVGRRPLAASWTRSLRQRLTLLAWRLGIGA